MTQFSIAISNCNSVDRAEIILEKGTLNIKYGPNGLGKSTLAKAIVGKVRGDDILQDLVPFKYRGNTEAPGPKVEGADDLTSALVFDDDYVQQFVFQKDEVLKNSFDIFIKTPEYVAAMEAIDSLLSGIKQALTNNAEIEQTIIDLRELRDAFGKSKPGSIPKSSKIHKAFGTGNKIENIPVALKPFETFIKSEEPSKWIAWQIKGNDFLKLGDTCPYCSTALAGQGQKDTALAVEKEYDAAAVKIKKTIESNQSSINAFLKSAGYKYSVEIVPEAESYKMKLVHHDSVSHLDTASKHLSYGEKNAFALVLFMYQVLSEKPDLVVLDDPISSFDKNKKFAILHELFKGKASLSGRTTLMLTHDIEPAIDVIKSTKDVFQASKPSASFLSSRGGVVREVPISKEDIQTFGKVCKANVAALQDPILKAIYLRRDYELRDDVGLEYNLLASLFKGRTVPTLQSRTENRDMTPEEKAVAEASIQNEHLPDFSYDALVAEVTDVNCIREKFLATDVGYEKIQLFRVFNIDHDDDVIRKFINESYHIENEYVMQLNPHKFESIPEYVIEECVRLLPMAS